jgi:hypothetical protein
VLSRVGIVEVKINLSPLFPFSPKVETLEIDESRQSLISLTLSSRDRTGNEEAEALAASASLDHIHVNICSDLFKCWSTADLELSPHLTKA